MSGHSQNHADEHLLTGGDTFNVDNLHGREVDNSAPTEHQILRWDSATPEWQLHAVMNCAFFAAEYDATHLTYRVQNIAASGSWPFTFRIPPDFRVVNDVRIVFIPQTGAGGSGKNIDLESNYGTPGNPASQFNETDAVSTYDLGTVGNLETYTLMSVLNNLAAGQFCGVEVQHNAIGGTVSYLGVCVSYYT